MNPFYHAILAGNTEVVVGTEPALNVNQVSITSLFWPMVYKSSLWPEITTTKDYFILYSTDHDSGAGGIWWGEFDDFIGYKLNGFVERGQVVSGYQAETPFLIRIPTAESGLTNDTIFLYYHTNGTDPKNATTGTQETHLITTTGGQLHSATWTYRGKPLGLISGENHTGYLRVWRRGTNDYVGHHVYAGGDVVKGKVSTSTGGLTYSRLLLFNATEGLPPGGYFERSTLMAFNRNAKLYGIFKYTDSEGLRYVAVAELDPSTYLPSLFIKTLLQSDVRDSKIYVEGDTAYILYKDGTTAANAFPYYLATYNLTDLD